MADSDELRVLREQVAALEERVDRLEQALARNGGPLLVETVEDVSYPTAAGVFYAVRQVVVGGPEVEGGTPTYSTVGEIFYAAHQGDDPPDVGTKVLALPVPYRWVFLH